MEGDFLTKGIHINVFDDEKDDIKGLRHKRKEIFLQVSIVVKREKLLTKRC